MPARATCAEDIPRSSRPSNIPWPSCAVSKPVRRLKNVDLPAPLGPISAVIEWRSTSKWRTLTATRPPKERITPSAVRMESGLGTPGLDSTFLKDGISTIDRDLPLVAEDALWSEDDETDQAQAEDGEGERLNLGLLEVW